MSELLSIRPVAGFGVTMEIGISRIMFILIHALVLRIVLRKMIHVGLVEHSTNDSLMQIRCRIERMLHNANLCTAPLDNQNHAIDQVSRCPGVHYWYEGGEIDDNEIKAFSKSVDQPLGLFRRKHFTRVLDRFS